MTISDTSVRALLAEVPLYRQLGDEDLEHLARVSSADSYPKGEVLFSQGESPTHFFAVARGRVKIVKSKPSGKDVILQVFGPGDPLGTVAVYEERPYPATAVALEDSICLRIPTAELFELLERRPSLVRGLLAAMTRRLVELTHRLTLQTAVRVETRLARLFVRLTRDLGRPEEDGVVIPLSLSRQDLADFTGTTIETAIRVMSRWGKEGIVETRDDDFLVRDPVALGRLAE